MLATQVLAQFVTSKLFGDWYLVVRRLSDGEVTKVQVLGMSSRFYATLEAAAIMRKRGLPVRAEVQYGVTRTPHDVASIPWLANR